MKNEPAFPCEVTTTWKETTFVTDSPMAEATGVAVPLEETKHLTTKHSGASMLDYFAAIVMPGVMNLCRNDETEVNEDKGQMFARTAYSIAAAMLAEREKYLNKEQ